MLATSDIIFMYSSWLCGEREVGAAGRLFTSLLRAANAPVKKYFSPKEGLSFCFLDC